MAKKKQHPVGISDYLWERIQAAGEHEEFEIFIVVSEGTQARQDAKDYLAARGIEVTTEGESFLLANLVKIDVEEVLRLNVNVLENTHQEIKLG